MIYAVVGTMGPLAYFKSMTNALAYWNYLQLGEGRRCMDAMGIHPDTVQLLEVPLMDEDEFEFMEWIHGLNSESYARRRLDEIATLTYPILTRVDQEQRDGEPLLAETRSDP